MWIMPAQQNVPNAATPQTIQMQLSMLNQSGMTPQEKARLAQAQNEYDRSVQQSILEQQNTVDSMRNNLEEYKRQPRGIDWMPAASFIDFLNQGRSNMAGAYAQSSLRPESQQTRMQRISEMESRIGARQSNISQQNISAMKANLDTMRQGMSTAASARVLESSLRDKRDATRRSEKRKEQFAKFSDKLIDEAGDEARGFKAIEAGFAPDPETGKPDFQKVMSTLGNYVRSVAGEKGVLTDQDIQRVLPRNFEGGIAKFKAMLSGDAPTAELPAGFVDVLRELTVMAKQKSFEKYQEQVDLNRKQTKTLWGNYKDLQPVFEEGYKNIDDSLRNEFGVPREPQGGALTPEEQAELEALEAEEAARGGK